MGGAGRYKRRGNCNQAVLCEEKKSIFSKSRKKFSWKTQLHVSCVYVGKCCVCLCLYMCVWRLFVFKCGPCVFVCTCVWGGYVNMWGLSVCVYLCVWRLCSCVGAACMCVYVRLCVYISVCVPVCGEARGRH